MVVGVDGVTPLSTSTGAVPVKRGIAPDIATIDTYSVSGDEISGTRRSRSMLSAFGGSELTSSRKAGQGGIFCRHAHSHRTPHARLYRIGDSWDDSARK